MLQESYVMEAGSAHHVRFHFRDLSWVFYALPCIAVWSAYLLSFFPGLMSADSIYQWDEIVSFRINDIHPAIHTLTNWLITRLWFSPAAVAIVQILGLAIVFGLTMQELGRWNVPQWTRILGTALFSLSPVNGVMAITLWKDIPYTIAMLALWLLLLKLVRTKDSALASRPFLLTLSIVVAAISLYRYNGVPVVAGILLLLWWLAKGHRRQIVLSSILWAAIFLFVKIPLFTILHVEPSPPHILLHEPVHQVGALRLHTPLTPEEEQFLDSIAPPRTWAMYNCNYDSPLVFDREFNDAFFDRNVTEFMRVWLALAIRNPSALATHVSCVTSLVWQIMQPPGRSLYVGDLFIDTNNHGLRIESRLPQLQAILSRVYEWSIRPSNEWWIWRPALYLCLSLAVILLIRLPLRDKIILLSPTLLQSLFLFVLINSEESRYQYPVYVIGLVIPALLFARRNAREVA